MQKKLFDALVVSVLKKIFGDDLITNLKFLSTKFLIEELNDAVAFLFPRRSGKTEACSLFIAILAVSQPGITKFHSIIQTNTIDWNTIMCMFSHNARINFIIMFRQFNAKTS